MANKWWDIFKLEILASFLCTDNTKLKSRNKTIISVKTSLIMQQPTAE